MADETGKSYAEQRNLKSYSLAEVAKHNKEDDCWIIIHGIVHDVTKFLSDHPGGSEVITCIAGQDTTSDFEEIGHSVNARKMALEWEVGVQAGCENTATGCVRPLTTESVSEPPSQFFGVLPFMLIAVAAVVAYFILNRS